MSEIVNVFITSQDRENGTISSCSVNLKNAVLAPKAYAVESVQMFNAQYTINNNNNQFHFRDSTNTAHTITLTNGNYTGSSLATLITNAMNTADTSSGDTYTVSFSSVTGKITIANDTSNFQLTFGNVTSRSVASTIGFNNTNLTGSQSYTGQNLIKLSSKYYIIKTDLGGKNQTHSVNAFENVLCVVNNSTTFGDLIIYQPYLAKTFKLNQINEISKIKFDIYDDNGNIADLQLDWSVNLTILK